MLKQNSANQIFSIASEGSEPRTMPYQVNRDEAVYWDAIKPRFYDRYNRPVTLQTKLSDLDGFNL